MGSVPVVAWRAGRREGGLKGGGLIWWSGDRGIGRGVGREGEREGRSDQGREGRREGEKGRTFPPACSMMKPMGAAS